ncbi:MAG: hypothetical protein WDW36_006014 [Sanguina aurantia]
MQQQSPLQLSASHPPAPHHTSRQLPAPTSAERSPPNQTAPACSPLRPNSRYPPTHPAAPANAPADALAAVRNGRTATDPGSSNGSGGGAAAPGCSHPTSQPQPQATAPPHRPFSAPRADPHPTDSNAAPDKPHMVSIAVGVGDSLMRGQVEPNQLAGLAAQARQLAPELRALSLASTHQQQQQQQQQQQSKQHTERQRQEAASEVPPTRPLRAMVQRPTAHTGSGGSGDPRDRSDPSDDRVTAGGRQGPPQEEGGSGRAGVAGLELLRALQEGHDAGRVLLMQRLSTAQMLRSFLGRGDVRGALACARRCGDVGAWSDLFVVLLARREVPFTLDLVADVVALADQVLSSPSQRHASVALEVVSLQLKAFGPVIRDTCSSAARMGIDLSFEQRREKCAAAKMALQGLVSKLSLMAHGGALGDADVARAQDLAAQLSAL